MITLVASGLGGSLWLLLLIGCPLMLIFMMRGMLGSGNASAGPKPARDKMSLDELKQERDELNTLIGDRAEQAADSRGYRREAPR